MKSLYCFLLLFCSVLLVIGGCSVEPTPDGFPKLYPVTVTIKQEGKELPGATVRLVPMYESNIWTTGAVTDSQGKAVLRTHGKYSGAPAGKFKVCVTKAVIEGRKLYSDMEKAENPKLKDTLGEEYYVIAKKYDEPANTPFEVEVVANNAVFEFDIPETVKTIIPYGGVQ
ncbi:MAG: hypothetical protein FWE67_02075 [Planctomycetaceae bacterium]|nr:hypothetical protein [Planctomycetaceae bacterium]